MPKVKDTNKKSKNKKCFIKGDFDYIIFSKTYILIKIFKHGVFKSIMKYFLNIFFLS